MSEPILIVDDDRSMCELIESDFRLRGIDTKWVTSADEALTSLKAHDFEVVLTDLRMPGMDGMELCRRIVANRPDLPVVVITGFGSLQSAVEALRAGAFDFVTKPIDLDVLALAIARARKHRELTEKVAVLSRAVSRSESFGQLLGRSEPMRRLYEQLDRTAASEASVLVFGESGTGKELVARALHERSARRQGPFVPVNCAALPQALLESELFGHVRGAFTDAHSPRKGLLVEANGGTLFLDELGDVPLSLQPKLLRVLEERAVRPVGSNRETGFDARIISATHRDLESAVEAGRFREDLFFRVNVIVLEIPPLRARGTDVLLLAQHFVEEFADRQQKNVRGLSRPVAEALLAYSWPGNVRELRNAMERAIALTPYDTVAVEDLPERIRDHRPSHVLVGAEDPGELLPLEEVEKRYILHVLRSVGNNRTTSARILGIDRKTLYRKLRRYGLEEED